MQNNLQTVQYLNSMMYANVKNEGKAYYNYIILSLLNKILNYTSRP